MENRTRIFDGSKFVDVENYLIDDLKENGFIIEVDGFYSISCNTLDDLRCEIEALEVDLEKAMKRSK